VKNIKDYFRKVRKKEIVFIPGVFFLILVFSISGFTQTLEEQIDEYISPYIQMERFSGSILVAQKGEKLLSKGYGMADYEHTVPNTPNTKFRLGSLTKQFTAMAIMQLQERGLLNVADPIINYLPDYPEEEGKMITIQHLLTHTSGIPDFTQLSDFQKTKKLPSTIEETIARFKDKELEFSPGEKYSYSNSGYILLGAMIEKVSGQSYENFLQENIFQPIRMADSGYDHHRTVLQDRAAGYVLSDEGMNNADYIDMSVPHGAGALYSTVEDLYLWDQALYTEKLVNRKTMQKIFTPFKESYGYGWKIDNHFNHKAITHQGGINGFATHIARYPEDDVCIIALANIEGAPITQIGKDLAAIVFGEEYDIPQERLSIEIDKEIYDSYVGEYLLKEDYVIEVSRENDHLFAQPTGQQKYEIYPESETKFFLKVADIEITFIQNEQDDVSGLIMKQGGKEMPAKKIN